ncbi:MAG: threonine/serine dehydratase [Bryobacterales bacterium]|nr:threonine/serine dehydratase [Bryobacterales bacterium]
MIREAAQRIAPIVRRTPVMTSAGFDAEAGVSAFFKCENLQRGGAFKVRGASNLVFSIPKADLPRGVIAFSSGNHAQGTALAARFVGAKATIVMPADAPRSKLEATRGMGATVVTYNRATENREEIAQRLLRETGATMVPPFDHPLIIAGQGTAALELLEEAPDLDALITPVGGGGLLSGCATAAKSVNANIRVFGAEPELANDTHLSFRAGRIVTIPTQDTIADGLRSQYPGEITFPIVQRLAEDIILVSEDEIKAAMRYLLARLKILVEPSGAAAAAAVLFRKLPHGIGRVGVVISGGNVDLEALAEYL